MDAFEPVDTGSEHWPTDGSDDHDLDVALLTCGREAFAGFTNLAALQDMSLATRHSPWRQH